MKAGFHLGCALCSLLWVGKCQAVVIGFEGVVPPNGTVNVGPTDTYTESGYTFTPFNYASAIFGGGAGVTFPGDSTAWFGFQGGVPGGPFQNPITLTGPGEFNLNSFIAGISSLAPKPTVDLTVTGYLFGGGTVVAVFPGLTTATLETVDWANLTSVVFASSTDAGLDDISVDAVPLTGVPEPATAFLLAFGSMTLSIRLFCLPRRGV